MKKEKTHDQKLNERAGLFIPAGLFIGMGVGFAAMALARVLLK